MEQPQGPAYGEDAKDLAMAAMKLALRVMENRPEFGAVAGGRTPELVVDTDRLVCVVALRLDKDRVAVLDKFSIDPASPVFGISEITLMPGAAESGTWH